MSEDNAPDVAAIAGRLSEAQRAFLNCVCTGRPLKLADRQEDRARQTCRQRGLVKVLRNPRRWVATDLGLAVHNHLMEKNDVQG